MLREAEYRPTRLRPASSETWVCVAPHRRDVAGFDQRLHGAPAQVGQPIRDEAIQPHAEIVAFWDEAHELVAFVFGAVSNEARRAITFPGHSAALRRRLIAWPRHAPDQNQNADRDGAVRHIEIGPRSDRDEIDHISQSDPVDEIAERAPSDRADRDRLPERRPCLANKVKQKCQPGCRWIPR